MGLSVLAHLDLTSSQEKLLVHLLTVCQISHKL
jgi:hypothetical protein